MTARHRTCHAKERQADRHEQDRRCRSCDGQRDALFGVTSSMTGCHRLKLLTLDDDRWADIPEIGKTCGMGRSTED